MSSPLNLFVRPMAAGILILAGLAAISSSASALPAGSYLQSCQNVYQMGDVLKANCRTKAGALRATTYQISKCRKPGDNLSNIDGRLRCAEALPGGTYRSTCRNDYVVLDGILYSYCETISGEYTPSQIKVSSCVGGVIANINGRLVCTR